MLTPEEIQSREFLVSLRGYDRDEVHAFLDRVADQIRDLQARLQDVDVGKTAATTAEPTVSSGDPSGMFEQIGQETNRILEAAHQAGAAIKRTARQEADKELQSARAEAARMIADGERRRDEVQGLVDELEQTKQQLAEDLRTVGRSIEGSMRQLLGEDAVTSSVREALTAEALPDDAEPPGDEDTAELPPVAPDGDEEGTPDVADEAVEESGPAAARTAALAPLDVRLVRQIKRGLHDVQNLVLDRLRREDGRGPLEQFLPTDEELLAFSVGVAETLDEAYAAGQSVAAEHAGRELPAQSEERPLVEHFLTDAADRIRGGLAANLRMGLEVDEDVAALSGRVSAVFGEIKQATTDEWAHTHLIRCYEVGQLDAWAGGGITHREWVVGVEPRCPEGRCRQNGQAGMVPLGERYPSGHETPPVHAGCTCTTVPVLEPTPEQPATDRS